MCASKPKVAKTQQPTVQQQDQAAQKAASDAAQQQASLGGRATLANQQTGYLGVPNQPGSYAL